MVSNIRPGAGAIEAFDYVRFGGPTRVRETHVSVTGVVRILTNSPDRVMVIIMNHGPDALIWSTKANVAIGQGFDLGSSQQEVFQVQNDGALCGVDIWATTAVADSEIQILELIRDRG